MDAVLAFYQNLAFQIQSPTQILSVFESEALIHVSVRPLRPLILRKPIHFFPSHYSPWGSFSIRYPWQAYPSTVNSDGRFSD